MSKTKVRKHTHKYVHSMGAVIYSCDVCMPEGAEIPLRFVKGDYKCIHCDERVCHRCFEDHCADLAVNESWRYE